ncbi:MAG: bifunctional nuclease family protein [Schleiferiaceae bacterium]|jgi:bifunctional DNase/RNase|tara:strand:+ start:5206 stop:5793 length:588 start_codon:yes stop_codon:yes gene_type:complete
MHEIEITVKGLSYSQGKSGAYALILAEKEGQGRKLPVVIGGAEAQSIAVAMEKSVAPPRPMTHDTWHNMLNELKVTVTKVVIHRLVNGVFFASIYSLTEDGVEMIFDSRPSDAVALAVRIPCPIFATNDILEQAGINDQEEKSADIDDPMMTDDDESLSQESPTIEDLESDLNKAVEDEDYERAAQLRDKIDKLT